MACLADAQLVAQMSKPRDAENLRQLATWVPADVKAELEKRAEDEKKPERTVVTEALTAHLRSSAVVAKPRRKGDPE